MSYTKEQVLEALKGVIYFPKSNNIVALQMVQDIIIEEKQISFTLIFPDSKDKSSTIVVPAARKAIKSAFGENMEVGIKVTSADLIDGEAPLAGVKNIIGVASGKGGVGKSTVAANLAIALANTGAKVGILDADIYGPSVPLMFGLVDGHPDVQKINGKDVIIPLEKYGIKILSVGFFVDPTQALIWRGSMVTNALKQLVNDTKWGEIDFLVVDLPPGTGDVQLPIALEQDSIIGKAFKNLADSIIEKTIQRNSEQPATERVQINH